MFYFDQNHNNHSIKLNMGNRKTSPNAQLVPWSLWTTGGQQPEASWWCVIWWPTKITPCPEKISAPLSERMNIGMFKRKINKGISTHRIYFWNIAHCSDPRFGGSMLGETNKSHLLPRSSIAHVNYLYMQWFILNSPYTDIYLQLEKKMHCLSPTRNLKQNQSVASNCHVQNGKSARYQHVPKWVVELPWCVFVGIVRKRWYTHCRDFGARRFPISDSVLDFMRANHEAQIIPGIRYVFLSWSLWKVHGT